MSIPQPRLNSDNFRLVRGIVRNAIAPMAIILVGAAPLSAQVIRIENRSTVYRTPVNSSIIYNNHPINTSIVYGSPIPTSVIHPHNFYSYPTVITYPRSFYSYPNYYPGSVTRVRERDPRTILINPTIIKFQPQRRYRAVERNTTIIRGRSY